MFSLSLSLSLSLAFVVSAVDLHRSTGHDWFLGPNPRSQSPTVFGRCMHLFTASLIHRLTHHDSQMCSVHTFMCVCARMRLLTKWQRMQRLGAQLHWQYSGPSRTSNMADSSVLDLGRHTVVPCSGWFYLSINDGLLPKLCSTSCT